jgi:hypothetical protein
MRRLTVTLSLILLISGLWAVTPADAADFCYEGEVNYTNNSSGDVDIYVTLYDANLGVTRGRSRQATDVSPGETVDKIDETFGSSTDLDFLYTTAPVGDGADIGSIGGVVIGASSIDPCDPPLFQDGRLNFGNADAPVIVYNLDNNRFSFYGVNQANGVGTELFQISVTTLRPVVEEAVATGQNLLIQERLGVAVYALSAGTCQMNVFRPDGTLYEYEWNCNISG